MESEVDQGQLTGDQGRSSDSKPEIRTLLLCSRPPWPLRGGDRIRTFHVAQALAGLGPVDLVALRSRTEAPEDIREALPFVDRLWLPVLQPAGAALRSAGALATGACLQQAIYRSASVRKATAEALQRNPQVVIAHLVRTVPWLPASSPPLIIDIQDAISAQYRAARGRARGWRGVAMALDTDRVRRAELAALSRADGVTYISEQDRAQLPAATVPTAIVRPGLARERFEPPPDGAEPHPGRIGFLGRLSTASNQDMVRHFARKLFPAIRAVVPAAEFWIFGAAAPASVQALGSLDGVRYVGAVDDGAAALHSCWLTVCPVRFGSGVQNKIVESLAAGTPVVASDSAAAALGPLGQQAVMAAADDDRFIAQTTALLGQPDLRQALAEQGRRAAFLEHGHGVAYAPLLALVEQLAARST